MEKNNIGPSNDSTPVADQTNRVLDETKKLGNQIYEEGKGKFDELQGNIKERPFHSLLIAMGVGFLLSYLFRK